MALLDQLASSSPKAAPEAPVRMYAPEDYGAAREEAYNAVLGAMASAPEVENERFRLRLRDVQWRGDPRPRISEVSAAVREGRTLHRPLVGRFELEDKQTGEVRATNPRTLLRMPVYTDEGSFVRDGIEYQVSNQFVREPGVYAGMRAGQPSALFSLSPGTGPGFQVRYSPEKDTFALRIRDRNVPLGPVLKALGYSQADMEKAWGKKTAAANLAVSHSGRVDRWLQDSAAYGDALIERGVVANPDPDNLLTATERGLRAYFGRMRVDPYIVGRTLGMDTAEVSPAMIARAAAKARDLHFGKAQADPDDSLEFRRVRRPGDVLADRLSREYSKTMKGHLWRVTNKNDLSAIPPAPFSSQVDALFSSSGLSQVLEQTNPLDMFNQAYRITSLGEGGIPDTSSAPMSARDVQPSYFGFVDPIRGPECFPSHMEVMTRDGWVPWPQVDADMLFACKVDGRLSYALAERLMTYDYSGDILEAYCGLAVTPEHRMLYRADNGEMVEATADRVPVRGVELMSGGHLPLSGAPVEFRLPEPTASGRPRDALPLNAWCAFLGYYLGMSGVVSTPRGILRRERSVGIKCKSPALREELCRCLDHLPFARTWKGDMLRVSGPGLVKWMDRFKQGNHVPDFVFRCPEGAKQAFVDAFVASADTEVFDSLTVRVRMASKRLAEDVEKLLFDLGASCHVYPTVEFGKHRWALTVAKNVFRPSGEILRAPYAGTVHCAVVPGGLLYVRAPGKHGFWCGNSQKIGLDMHLARGVRIGSDGRLYRPLVDARTGETRMVSSREAARAVVGFPSALTTDKKYVTAIDDRTETIVPREKLDYILPNPDDMTSPLMDTIPLKSGVKSMRALMAAKFASSAIPLVKPETPLVQTLGSDGRPSAETFGSVVGARFSPASGVVASVGDDSIVVRDADGQTHEVELYNHRPYARHTNMHNRPLVEPGALVEKGQPLVASNYTDDKGRMAIGRNLRVAWKNHDGQNFEDAVVVSQSAADEMRAGLMETMRYDIDDRRVLGKKAFASRFPGKYTRAQLDNLDDDGMAKPGVELQPGDPVFLGVSMREGRQSTLRSKLATDASKEWDHHVPGRVVASNLNKDGARVEIEADAPLEIGDKLAIPFGGKGTVAAIIPDDRMEKDAAGRPIGILFSAKGIQSRANSAQVPAAILGKVARVTGQPYNLPGYMTDVDAMEFAMAEAEKHGVDVDEEITDGETGIKIPNVLVGDLYVYRMKQTAFDKGKARGIGGYTAEGTPRRGVGDGARHLGQMEYEALLAHGALDMLRDLKVVHGQENSEFWRRLQFGQTPSIPDTPLVYRKFVDSLKAVGVSVDEGAKSDSVFAMTDAEAKELTGSRKLSSAATIDIRDRAMSGGLFDEKLTGGVGGDRFAYMELPEPMLNPLMEKPAKAILGWTAKQYDAIASGETEWNGLRGPKAMAAALKSVDVDARMREARAVIADKGAPMSRRDDAYKAFSYLAALKKNDRKLTDFLMTRVPVLPPKYRPITRTGDTTIVSDPNRMYRQLHAAIEDYKDSGELGPELQSKALSGVMSAYRQLIGIEAANDPKLVQQKVGGILQQIVGKGSPKLSFIQRRVLGADLDMYGAGAAVPDPSLSLDEVGIPEDQAWTSFGPFVIRRLVQQGVPSTKAAQMVEARDPKAKGALIAEMDVRPVIVNRAPTLHKLGLMSFMPKLRAGDAMRVNPWVHGGYALDHDGDLLSFIVPITRSAVEDAKTKMMPSRNLLSNISGRPTYAPTIEYAEGMWLLSKEPDMAKNLIQMPGATRRQVLEQVMSGRLRPDQRISI